MKKIITGILILLLFALMGSHADTAEQESIRGVQDMLKQCGFNPGPIDGLWGSRTAKAAKNYIRAHGGSPQSERNLIVAQVDGYRVGDDGPCPTGKQVGSAVDWDDGTADQAQEKEQRDEDNLIAEIQETRKMIEREMSRRSETAMDFGYGNSRHIGEARAEILGSRLTVQRTYRTETLYTGGTRGVDGSSLAGHRDWEQWRIKIAVDLSDLSFERGEVSKYNTWNCRKNIPCVSISSRHSWSEDHVDASNLRRNDLHYKDTPQSRNFDDRKYNFLDLSTRRAHSIIAPPNFSGLEEYEIPYELMNHLIALNSGGTTGKPAKCIEWANLGSISTGAWRNGNGRVTRGFEAGDLGRAYDRPELVKNYEASHQHCLDINENTMKQVMLDMVMIGRKSVDIDNEKRQIRDYFQGKVRECQAKFTMRFRKYEDKFCE